MDGLLAFIGAPVVAVMLAVGIFGAYALPVVIALLLAGAIAIRVQERVTGIPWGERVMRSRISRAIKAKEAVDRARESRYVDPWEAAKMVRRRCPWMKKGTADAWCVANDGMAPEQIERLARNSIDWYV